jgi:hypothetical protein
MSKRQAKDIKVIVELSNVLRRSGVYIEDYIHSGNYATAAQWLDSIQPFLNQSRRPMKRLAEAAGLRMRWKGLWPWQVGWQGFLCGLVIGIIGTSIFFMLILR